MKRSYELTFIVRIDPNDEVINETVQQVKTWVEDNDNGAVKKIDVWGRRRLAYEINGQREGYYVLYYADLDPEHLPELERNLKLSNTVLRYLLVHGDDAKAAVPVVEIVDEESEDDKDDKDES